MRELTAADLEFWLHGSRWFGMTMYPGYGGAPYHSPIHLEGFQLHDDDTFCLDFFNLAYAAGVKNFSLDLEVVRGTESYQFCIANEKPDRAYVFVPLTLKWFETYYPTYANRSLFDAEGNPNSDRIMALGG